MPFRRFPVQVLAAAFLLLSVRAEERPAPETTNPLTRLFAIHEAGKIAEILIMPSPDGQQTDSKYANISSKKDIDEFFTLLEKDCKPDLAPSIHGTDHQLIFAVRDAAEPLEKYRLYYHTGRWHIMRSFLLNGEKVHVILIAGDDMAKFLDARLHSADSH